MADKESERRTEEPNHGAEENPETGVKNSEILSNFMEEYQRRSLQSELIKAIIHKSPLEEIQKLIHLGADINGTFEYEMRPIHFAASADNVEVLELCLNFGCDINSKDCCGLTPVHLSTQKGHIDCLTYLISQGANVRVDEMGYKAAKRVKDKPDTLLAVGDKNKNAGSNTEVDKKPIESDDESEDRASNTSGKAPKGFTMVMAVEPLNFALENNHIDAVKLLLENGANPNRWYPVGYEINLVPLENIRCLELMLDYGANPNAVDRCGYTPLMMAAKTNHISAAKLLVSRNANINQQRPDRFEKKTALHIALESKHRDIVKLLLLNEAIILKLPGYKYNALHTAVLTDQVDLVELILFFTIYIDEMTDDNCTALMLACANTESRNQMQIIHKLLQNGDRKSVV